MNGEQNVQNHMSKGQLRLIEQAGKSGFSQEQIEYMSKSPMLISLCDVYFQYFKLCNNLNIPPQNSVSVLKNEDEGTLFSCGIKYFIGRNLLGDIELNDKIPKGGQSFGEKIKVARCIAELLKRNKNSYSELEKDFLGKLCATNAGRVMWQLVGDNKSVYGIFIEGITELIRCIEEKYGLVFEDVVQYLQIITGFTNTKQGMDFGLTEVIAALQEKYKSHVIDTSIPENTESELWEDLIVIYEYIYPMVISSYANYHFGHYVIHSTFPVVDMELLIPDIKKIYPNYKISEDCMHKIIEIIRNIILTKSSREDNKKAQKVDEEVYECIMEDASIRTPIKSLNFSINTKYEPLAQAKVFMQGLETMAASLCKYNEENAQVQHVFSTKYEAFQVQTKNERGYDYISFAIGNAVIKLNETQENSATVRVISMYDIIQYNFIFNTETGNLFIEHKGKKCTKWYPATVKILARILRLLNALKKYAIVSEYYKQFIGAVMQWHREKGHLIVNEIEKYIYDELFLPPMSFNELVQYKSFKEAFSGKYTAPRNWSWNITNANIMYAAYNVAKYVQPMDKSRVYDIVAEVYNKYSIDNVSKGRFDCSYAKRKNINHGVMTFLELYYFEKLTSGEDKNICYENCYECDEDSDTCNKSKTQMYIKDYVQMSIQTKTPISLGITSIKKLKEKHDQMQMIIIAQKTPKLVIPKDTKFKHLRELLPEHFEYITTRKRLIEETIKQNHCVAAYANEIKADKIAIYSFVHPDKNKRYTVEFGINKKSKSHKYQVIQVAGYNNDEWNDKELIEYIEQYI